MTTTLIMRKRWVMPQGTKSGQSPLLACPVRRKKRSIWGRKGGRRTVSIVPKEHELIAPLCDDPERIFQESDDNKEPTDGRDISSTHATRQVRSWFFLLSPPSVGTDYRRPPTRLGTSRTYGLIGSDTVSSQSSILLVCSRIVSNGLGSLVASCLPGTLPKGL